MISKRLSANDTGETGAHQAGILIPKDERVLRYFPQLSDREKNPRCRIHFRGPDGREWHFNFIHYNNQNFGGTRNEYRLTGMTEFIRSHLLSVGDEIVFDLDPAHGRTINIRRAGAEPFSALGVLRLSRTWTIITTK